MTLKDAIYQDFWVHFGALVSVALGVSYWYLANGMKVDPPALGLVFIVGGFSAFGIKLINGSSAALRQAISVAKSQPVVVPPVDPTQPAA